MRDSVVGACFSTCKIIYKSFDDALDPSMKIIGHLHEADEKPVKNMHSMKRTRAVGIFNNRLNKYVILLYFYLYYVQCKQQT